MPLVDWLSHLTSSAAIPDADSIVVAFIDADEGTGTGTRRGDLDSDTSSPESLQPPTPQDHNSDIDRFTMPTTSPIDIATTTRNASSSPSSQGKKVPNYHHDTDSRTSAMMSTGFDSSMGRGRQDSFGGAKPISMNNPNRNADGRPRRESLAGSLVGGMSWGGVSVGSWIRDEYVYPFIHV
jgi:transcription factor SFP1